MKRLIMLFAMFYFIAAAQAQNITNAEYFFDADPGVGNGTSITISTPGETVNFSAAISTGALSQGFHFLAIRVRDAVGNWSQYEKRGFYISTSVSAAADITAAEYFLDADPGSGNGTPLSVGASGSTVNFTANIPTSLSPGFHFLAIRVKGSDGIWGLFEKRGFYISGNTTDAANIVAAEYFLDTDPGSGNGIPLSVGVSGSTVNFTANIPTSLSAGFHFLAIRVKGSDGMWGLFEKRGFYVSGTTIDAADIVAAEYFIDNDPGVGSGSSLSVGTPGGVVNFTANIPTSLSPGFHFLAIRVKDTDGKWSFMERRGFYVSASVNDMGNIVAAEYFFNSDPGLGSGTPLTFTTPGSVVTQTFLIPEPSLPLGIHYLSIRVKDVNGYWSLFSYDTLTIGNSTISCPSNVSVNTAVGQCSAIVNNIDPIVSPPQPNNYTLTGATTGSGTGSVSGMSFNAGVTTVTYTLTNIPSLTCLFTVTVTAIAPTISQQPLSQSVCAGGNVTFNVTATGSGLLYQWRKGGVNIGGATSSSYTINGLSVSDAAGYSVVVSTACGTSVTSNTATLTVNTPPAITTQPVSQTVCPGDNVTFSVTATGSSLTYQWRKGGVNISGATGSSYTINGVAAGNAGNYDVVISGTCPPTVTSNTVTLTVNVPPSITVQPTSQTICAGGNVTFNVAATGTALTYQWRKGGVNISGATSSSYTINGVSVSDAGNYDVLVSGACPPTATSSTVSLTVNTAPAITIQPTSQTVCAGTNVTFSVTATGSGLSYQWRKGGVNISGATSSSYSITGTATADAGSYDVVISGTCPPTVTSNTVTLTVNVPPSITIQPTSQIICAGGNVTFNVTATGTALTYQWRKGGVNISGATSSSYTINGVSVSDAGNYDVVVSGVCPPIATSSTVSLTVNTAPAITTQPISQTVCAGTNVTFSVTATGTTLTYQWRKGGVSISGATSSSYSITGASAADAGSYDVVISGTCSPSVTSTAVTLTVNPLTVISIQPVSQTVCSGTNVTFSVTATGTGTLTYQWKKNGTDISGATSDSYVINGVSASDAASYSVIVTGGCGSTTSNTTVLSVNPLTVITAQPGNQSACVGGGVTFTVSATGSGTLTYQWKKDGTDISGATSSSYSINPVSSGDGGIYTVVVTGNCGSVTSAGATLSISSATVINTQPTNQSSCLGGSVTYTVSASGSGTVTYQWKKNGIDISGATSSSYTINPVTSADAAGYSVLVNSLCGSTTSATASLSIIPATSIITQPTNKTVCSGSNAVFTVAATGDNLSYQWRYGGVDISGATSSSYTITGVNSGNVGNYDVVVTGTCGAVTSTAVTLALGDVVISAHPVSQSVCAGANVTFSVTATGTGISYQWRKDGTIISGATSATYTITGVTTANAGSYDVIVGGTCESLNSNAATLTVNTAPAITSQPVSQAICLGANITFNVSATGTNLSYQWRKAGVNINGANSASYTITSATATDAGNYDVVISGTCSPSITSNIATLSITPSPSITIQPSSQVVFVGSNVTFSVTATGAGLSYQWRKGGVNIPGATSASYIITGVVVGDAGDYDVVVTGTCSPSVSSNTAVLTVNTISITTQPTNQAVCVGANATFSIVVAGNNPTYQWQVSSGGGPFTNITGATASTLTLNSVTLSQNGNQYRCVVSNSLNSNAATLTVNPLPAVVLNLPFDTLYRNSPAQTLSGGSPAGGTYSGTSTTGSFVNPATLQTGNYTITYNYTDVNGCSGSATDVFTVIPKADLINIYPNPVINGNATLIVSPELVGGYATIYNSLGQKVSSWMIAGRRSTYNFKWAVGQYVLVIRNGSNESVKQFTITR